MAHRDIWCVRVLLLLLLTTCTCYFANSCRSLGCERTRKTAQRAEVRRRKRFRLKIKITKLYISDYTSATIKNKFTTTIVTKEGNGTLRCKIAVDTCLSVHLFESKSEIPFDSQHSLETRTARKIGNNICAIYFSLASARKKRKIPWPIIILSRRTHKINNINNDNITRLEPQLSFLRVVAAVSILMANILCFSF